MLNEMNPKLKALLAAGLIGTAGLGMQSCSNPSDSVYYPYTVEAPSTDNPGSGGAETSNPSSDEENGGGRETVNKNEVTFKDLGVEDPNVQRRIAANKEPVFIQSVNAEGLKGFNNPMVYVNSKFINLSDLPDEGLPLSYNAGTYKYNCGENGIIYNYFIPADEELKNSFDSAIKAYRASQSNQ